MKIKNTKTQIVKEFVRKRSNNKFASFLAADTTLLCSGIIYTKQKDEEIQNLGSRIIHSVLKAHNIGSIKRENFVDWARSTRFNDVKKFILRLQPYKEMKRWIEIN